jgi:uncharacterized protein (TIGR03790 family)
MGTAAGQTVIRRSVWRAALLYLPLLVSQACATPVHLSLPKYRLQADELAVIVNDADPLSVQIGEYYRQARHLPPGNLLHVRFEPGGSRMSAGDFARLKAAVDRITPARIQAYAITWAAPYRVDCMSITAALTFGFDRAWCSSHKCAATQRSPYFGYTGADPWHDLGIRPSISIAATGFADARALIDRGVASDGSLPAGTAYLLSTSDKARNVRAWSYPRIEATMQDRVATQIVNADSLRDRDDVLFYFTGKTRVEGLDSLRFLPGAIADHLTSAGGKLTGSGQMSALRWLQAGATGSFGTVVEPCNLTGKFPNPGVLMDLYTSGRTLIEAYWQSVQQPGEGIFIGEPLAAPFDRVRVEQDGRQLHLYTRSLLPGTYQLAYADFPVGPWRTLGLFNANYHQDEFVLPRAGDGYYRVVAAGADLPPGADAPPAP